MLSFFFGTQFFVCLLLFRKKLSRLRGKWIEKKLQRKRSRPTSKGPSDHFYSMRTFSSGWSKSEKSERVSALIVQNFVRKKKLSTSSDGRGKKRNGALWKREHARVESQCVLRTYGVKAFSVSSKRAPLLNRVAYRRPTDRKRLDLDIIHHAKRRQN